jgi:hypothetical protein
MPMKILRLKGHLIISQYQESLDGSSSTVIHRSKTSQKEAPEIKEQKSDQEQNLLP